MFKYHVDDVRFARELYFQKFKNEEPALEIVARSEDNTYANADVFLFEEKYLVVLNSGDDECLLYDDISEMLYPLRNYFDNFKYEFGYNDVQIRYKFNNEKLYDKFDFSERMEFNRITTF